MYLTNLFHTAALTLQKLSFMYMYWDFPQYRSGTVNLNTVDSKFHLIWSYCEYLATILSFHV